MTDLKLVSYLYAKKSTCIEKEAVKVNLHSKNEKKIKRLIKIT